MKNLELHVNFNSVFQFLSVIIFTLFLIWYAQFHWRRRRMYELAGKVPGPKGYPIIGCALDFLGGPSLISEKLLLFTQKYPNILKGWLGPMLIYSVTKPEYIEKVLKECLDKGYVWKFAEPLIGHGLLTVPAHRWKKNRRIFNPAFNQQLLDLYVDCFAENGAILVTQLKLFKNQEHGDIYPNMLACMTDIISETAFEVTINAQKTGQLEFAQWLDELLSIFVTRIFNVFYYFDFIFYRTNLAQTGLYNLTKLYDFTSKIVKQKREEFRNNLKNSTTEIEPSLSEHPKTRKSLLTRLIELSEVEGKLTDEELIHEVNTIAIAGTETVTTLMCFFFMALGICQDVQQKIYGEIIEIVGHDRSVASEDLPRLEYLERAIKETLRLFPAVPQISRSIDKEIDLGEYTLASGSLAFVGILPTHRNPLYWENPLEFNPDRFLPEEIEKKHPYTFMPFGGGPRNCIGFRFATMAMKTLAATVIRAYKIRTPYKSIKDIELKLNFFLKPVDGFKISLEDRIE